MTMQCVCNTTTYQLVSPSGFQPEMEMLVATHESLYREVRRQHRLGAPTHEYRIVINWEELTKSETDTVFAVWAFLKNGNIASLTDPSGRVLSIFLGVEDRSLEMNPYALADGTARYQASLIVRGY